jgi:segregation and condensation protein B
MMPNVLGRPEAPEADESEAEAMMNGESEDNVADAVVSMHPRAERAQHLRIIEAILFAATEPVGTEKLMAFLPQGTDCEALLADLETNYANRGVNLVRINGKYMLRTAPDVAFVLRREQVQQKRLTKAGLETLAIIAYHQPVTRAEIEEIRGVAISKGTLDILLEIGWAKMRGRRKSPGRPVTYGTTEAFMRQFGLNEITDLPGLQELKAAGLLDSQLPPGFDLPMPAISDELTSDEDPLDGTENEPPLEMHLEEPESTVLDGEEDPQE